MFYIITGLGYLIIIAYFYLAITHVIGKDNISGIPTAEYIMGHIIFGLFYPAVLIVAMWNATGAYLDTFQYKSMKVETYKQALKEGYDEFINSNKRMYNNYLTKLKDDES